MGKILSQSGTSLSDLYDVEGSIVGVAELLSREVSLFHEMGATLFSERLSSTILRVTTGAQLQNVASDVTLANLPRGVPMRILSVQCLNTAGGRTANLSLSVRDVVLEREIPLFTWNTSVDSEVGIRFEDDGGGVSTKQLYRTNDRGGPPTLLVGLGQSQAVSEIVLRALTGGFGAGTVEIIALIQIAFADDPTGLSSRGLPVPSW